MSTMLPVRINASGELTVARCNCAASVLTRLRQRPTFRAPTPVEREKEATARS